MERHFNLLPRAAKLLGPYLPIHGIVERRIESVRQPNRAGEIAELMSLTLWQIRSSYFGTLSLTELLCNSRLIFSAFTCLFVSEMRCYVHGPIHGLVERCIKSVRQPNRAGEIAELMTSTLWWIRSSYFGTVSLTELLCDSGLIFSAFSFLYVHNISSCCCCCKVIGWILSCYMDFISKSLLLLVTQCH